MHEGKATRWPSGYRSRMRVAPSIPQFRARVRRLITGVLCALLPAADAVGQTASDTPPPAIPREFRGAWVASVANIDWPSKPGLSAWAQQAEPAGAPGR